MKLRPILTRQLKPGARIVSHAFSMGPTWPADKVDRFTGTSGTRSRSTCGRRTERYGPEDQAPPYRPSAMSTISSTSCV